MPKRKNKIQKVENNNTENKTRWAKGFRQEIKKIIWPTGKELAENTVVVLTSVIIVALIIFVLDFAFSELSNLAVTGVSKVVNTTSTENTVEESTEDVNSSELLANSNLIEITE